MTDTEILDWLQEHLCSFRQTLQSVPDSDDMDAYLYEMEWMDDAGAPCSPVRGVDLRDCVKKALDIPR